MSQFLIDNSLLIVVIAVSVLGLLIPVINTRRYAPEVSPAQATELINRQGAQIVDVRKAADFAKGHIANSRNIPADQIQNEFGKLKRERPVILVDQTGAGSRPVARLLRGVGFQRVTILERGIVGCRPRCRLNNSKSSPYPNKVPDERVRRAFSSVV